ncbi:saccharopine dehydrogenase C-terminal domain-containing protein [Okeania sp.]|uniref:saccharopine dehydrogenase family protein n=1 Tax=Okeania sp. TaxID=3100323 RepID=UPI002B4ADB15|nr:saccharopine dehydrogenase C-terminal domain-containing protein [Okeania sp.]MEB3342765.1 saccharopine dehydrogenase C-terminal domain-containing protein [Okeania sp.]
MHNVTILGAGKIGSAIAKLLHYSEDYTILVGDREPQALENLTASWPVNTFVIDVTDETALTKKLEGQDCVVSACSYEVNPIIARAAAQAGVSYFDLTEDVETTNAVRSIAETTSNNSIFVPQCGLAPGFIGILAHHLCSNFDKLDAVKMRVGALPQYPSNMMMYNLTWSTKGLINEYCNPGEAILNGCKIEALPLEEVEHFSVDGVNYEAFNTSGGLGTLCETLEGQVQTLNYKTIRYPGHQYLIKFLTNELGLSDRRELLEEILENSIPITKQDVVIIFCTVTGWKNGHLQQISDVRKIYPLNLYGENWSSIQLTTASSLCAVLDMYLNGKITHSGFLKQEDISLDTFLNNRFGCYYAQKDRNLVAPGI